VLVPAEGVVEAPEAEYASVNQLMEGGHLEQRPVGECVLAEDSADRLGTAAR
jgi:hypothetical protein